MDTELLTRTFAIASGHIHDIRITDSMFFVTRHIFIVPVIEKSVKATFPKKMLRSIVASRGLRL